MSIPISLITANKNDVKGTPMHCINNAPLYYPKCSLVPISKEDRVILTEKPLDIKKNKKKRADIWSYLRVFIVILTVIVFLRDFL
jgi:hypothetical protein